jgi:hypothetical protein
MPGRASLLVQSLPEGETMFASPESAERLVETCEAGGPCRRLACFQARIQVFSGHELIHRRTNACASHVVDAVQGLGTWARDQAETGWMEVLAIDPYAAAEAAGAADSMWRPGYGFAFYAEPVDLPAATASFAQGSSRA